MEIKHSRYLSRVTDSEIHRISVAPDENSTPRGTIILLHGLGDHIMTHQKVMSLFSELGYQVEGFDWPGNGESEGNRGDIPGVKPAIELLREVIDLLNEKPVGIYAHSTGGFLIFPFLSRFQKEIPIDWLWLSSPLLRPKNGQPEWKIQLSELVADFFPKLTIGTGVKPSRCYHVSNLDAQAISQKFKGCHSKISVRFGRDLMLWEDLVWEIAADLRDPLKIFFSQGDEDDITPPEFAEQLFQSIPVTDKTFLLMKEIRHEPLREADSHKLLDPAKKWLESVTNPGERN